MDTVPRSPETTCGCETWADVPHFLETLSALGHSRNFAILRTLADGPLRFNDIVAATPSIPASAVSTVLRDLDAEGLLCRRVVPGPPLRVMYELTRFGAQLIPAARSLGEWAERRAPAKHIG
jgi:DNA-binding HxlR family transcriptional regulator